MRAAEAAIINQESTERSWAEEQFQPDGAPFQIVPQHYQHR